jgi:hypothetical protein
MPAAGLIAVAAISAAGTAYAASQTPDAPDYGKASAEGLIADINTLPVRRMIEAAAKTGGTVTFKDFQTGENKTFDFKGYGEADVERAKLDYQLESADRVAASTLALEQKYGSDFIKTRLAELEQSDPTGFALRKKLGETVSSELDKGYGLSDSQRAEVVGAERAAQAARGNILGSSSGASEAMAAGDAGYRLYQQRLANASSFLSGTTPVAQFGQLSSGQQGVTPFAMQSTNFNNLTGLNPNAGGQASQFAMSSYNAQLNASNPWQTFAGSMSGQASSVLGQYLGNQLTGGKT